MTETLVETVRAEDPLRALETIAAAQRRLEVEMTVQVRRARHQGASWIAIAAALGVSRQAAHKRFAGRRGLLGRKD